MQLYIFLHIPCWGFLWAPRQGRLLKLPGGVDVLLLRLYVLFMNRLYLDQLYLKLGQIVTRVAHHLEKRLS